MDRSRSLTTVHREKIRNHDLKSLRTKIQVKPNLTIKGSPNKTGVEFTLTLDSRNKDCRYRAKIEAELKELGNPKAVEEVEFDENNEVTEYQIILANRKEVEEHNSESLEIEIQVTVYRD